MSDFFSTDDECYNDLPVWLGNKIDDISENQFLFSSNSYDIINNVNIWHKQRLLEEDRINEIVEYQLDIFDKTNRFNFLGCYYICKVNEEYILIDGQHRLAAIKSLIDYHDAEHLNIFVWLFILNNENEIKEIFQNINKVKPISLPDFIQDNTTNIINEACFNLLSKYRRSKWRRSWSTKII